MASFSDDFNRANSSDLGAGWVEVSGDWSIVSQQLSPGAAGGTIILRAAGAMDTDDNYAQVTIAATVAASQGVWCRGNANISSGYLWRNDGSTWDLFSVVGGSFTAIGSYAAAAAPGDVAKVQAVGSTIKCFVNGVERVSITNTHVTTGTSVGIRSESAGAIRFDDFAAADVSAGASLGAADSGETAQPVTGAKAATLGAGTEDGGTQPLTGTKTVTLTPVAEHNTSQAPGGTKTGSLGTAGALETAQPLSSGKAAALTPALEDDAAHPLAGGKRLTLGVAAETSTVLPFTDADTTPADQLTAAVSGPALETAVTGPALTATSSGGG